MQNQRVPPSRGLVGYLALGIRYPQMQLDRQPAIWVVRALIRSVRLDYRYTVAVFELLIAVDTNLKAGCHGCVLPNGCIT